MTSANILQIGATDQEGDRFNGQDLHKHLRQRGWSSNHLVWNKTGDDAQTHQLKTDAKAGLQRRIQRLEYQFSLQSLLYPFAFELPFNPHFQRADLVHYHLIHTGYFSLAALPLLTKLKPTVWTLHDPWAMTGHCVHPFECQRWKTGCGQCPDLKTIFPLKKDNTALLWRSKQLLYAASNIDIVVASNWMLKMAEQSPLMSKFRLHRIPFGIDLTKFTPGDTPARKADLGIPQGNMVICLRANSNDFKGLEYVQEAFDRFDIDVPITILAFNQKGHFDKFLGRHHIVEVGWIKNTDDFVKVVQAADLFLMPSTAESFGMMAIEAMACGKPTIVFDGTALPEVTFAPQGAMSVRKDTDCLVQAMKELALDESKRRALGETALRLARSNYDISLHVDRMTALYEGALRRARRSPEPALTIAHNDDSAAGN